MEMENGNYLPWQRSGVVESISEAILCMGSSSTPFKYIHSYRIIEWFGLEGTSKVI